MKRGTLTLRVALCAAVLGGAVSCAKKEGGESTGDDKVLAQVGGHEIRRSEVQGWYDALPASQRNQFNGAAGQQRLLEQIINRKLMLVAAEDLGLDQRPAVRKRLDNFREQTLAQAFNEYLQENLPQPTEQDLQEYFDRHTEEFKVPARVNASWIKCKTREQALDARRRIVVGGEAFANVAREVTTDECSQRDGGLLGYFNPVGYVRCIGMRPEFQAIAFELEADDVSDVFAWDEGWAFIKLHEKTTERDLPFAKARETIVARLRPALNDSVFDAEYAKLRDKYGVKMHYSLEEELADQSADDLMRLATETTNSHDKIAIYEVLLKRYPQYERADEARFMVGFTYSEELKDLAAARREFERVVEEYPQSEIRESAVYMLQNLGKDNLPQFEQQKPTATQTP
jgi:parvulin-like peptidyl-prolyl isomerase